MTIDAAVRRRARNRCEYCRLRPVADTSLLSLRCPTVAAVDARFKSGSARRLIVVLTLRVRTLPGVPSGTRCHHGHKAGYTPDGRCRSHLPPFERSTTYLTFCVDQLLSSNRTWVRPGHRIPRPPSMQPPAERLTGFKFPPALLEPGDCLACLIGRMTISRLLEWATRG